MDDDLRRGIGLLQALLHLVGDGVGPQQAQFIVQFQVQLDKGVYARPARAQIMHAAHLGVCPDYCLDLLALLIGQFPVHQMVEGPPHDLPGAVENIERDSDGKQGIEAAPALHR